MYKFIVLMSVIVLLSGCSKVQENLNVEAKENEMFTIKQQENGVITIHEFIGVQGQLGMLDVPTATDRFSNV